MLYSYTRILAAFTRRSVSERVSHIFRSILSQSFIICIAETISALQAFRKRHADAVRVNHAQTSQPTTVDFAHYRSVLKNQAIIDEAGKLLKDFKPMSYDVSSYVKVIETFEVKAVSVGPGATSRYRY